MVDKKVMSLMEYREKEYLIMSLSLAADVYNDLLHDNVEGAKEQLRELLLTFDLIENDVQPRSQTAEILFFPQNNQYL